MSREASVLENCWRSIENINFDMLGRKIKSQSRLNPFPWTADEWQQGITQYKRYIFILRKYQNGSLLLPPSSDIDEIWHHHILDTRHYFNSSFMIFGGYMHHFPYFGMRDTNDYQDLLRAFELTEELYELEYAERLYAVRSSS